MKAPLVSVIVPNYNHAPYLRERIDSILHQTCQDFELILLDDCSTDDSREIINSYKDNPHVSHIVLNEKNSGNTFIQWDKGVSLARGKYIWIAESDDVALPQLLGTLVEQLEKHPEASVAYCHSKLINAEGHIISEHNQDNPAYAGQITLHDSRQFVRYLLNFNFIYNASMAVFCRKYFFMANPDFKDYRFCGDWHFWASISACGKVIEVHDMLNLFRQHQRKVTEHAKTMVALRWKNELQTIDYLSSLYFLTKLEKVCLKGRLSKRLRNAEMSDEEKQHLRKLFPSLCDGNMWHVLCYEIGKSLFGFLRNYQKMLFLSRFF